MGSHLRLALGGDQVALALDPVAALVALLLRVRVKVRARARARVRVRVGVRDRV